MSIDILYRNDDSIKNAGYMSMRSIYHLCLDKALKLFFPDLNRSQYFYEILTRPLTNSEDIKFRQDIFTDFTECDGLFDSLYNAFSKFKEAYVSHQRSKSTAYGGMMSSGGGVGIAFSALQMNALFTKRAMLYVRELYKVLEKAEIKSEGLIRLRDEIGDFANDPSIDEAIRFSSKFEAISLNKNADIKIQVNDDGLICSASLIDDKFVKYASVNEGKGFLSFFKKQRDEEEAKYYSFISSVDSEFYRSIVSGAYLDLSYAFEGWGSQIYDLFIPVFKQLEFYGVGLKYISRLKHYGAPLCFPVITDKKGFDYVELYDMLLVMSNQSIKKVVPNTISVDSLKEGILIFGGNGSGKTVFLRSLGCMQVLAQGGLPVPAERSRVYPYSTIHTQFSEGEKMFVKGNDAGRFEQEVSEISEMVDRISDNSLIILNETFQTTAYDEGAKGLYHILKYFTGKNVMWILVSHLTQLKDYYDKESAYFMHTDGEFHVVAD